MKLTWNGHACFTVECGGHRTMLDPYHEVVGLPDIHDVVDDVLCSHGHRDHAYIDELIVTGNPSPLTVETMATWHDDQQGALRGANTVHILSAEGLKVVHLGDLGHMLSAEQAEKIAGCDVLMIPVGGTYTLTADQAAEQAKALHPRVIIPMHYHKDGRGYPVLQGVEEFLVHFPAESVRVYEGSTMDLSKDTPEQVAVLTYVE